MHRDPYLIDTMDILPAATSLGNDSPVGLYIHVPFCLSKCPYCSFNSAPVADSSQTDLYMAALTRQARFMATQAWAAARKFSTLFIGGGTPTLADPYRLAVLIETCLAGYDFDGGSTLPEITVEANPNAVSLSALRTLRQAGVNRLSLGVQSFSDTMLSRLGRSHSRAEGVEAFALARRAGFDNISLDLMYGLPGQQSVDWEQTLAAAIDLAPEHLSIYELTVEEGTPFGRQRNRGELALPEEEEILAMDDGTREMMHFAGYARYEIANYARPGYQCRHNIHYWRNGGYLGLGAGAVSCFDGVRIKNVEDPVKYGLLVADDRFPFCEGECLPLGASFRETVIMGLRMTAGVSCQNLLKRYGLTPEVYYGETVHRLMAQNMLEMDGDYLRLTEQGLPIANQIMAQLV
jgi:oxygen-independent coproporphyrinogen-3 oxidase